MSLKIINENIMRSNEDYAQKVREQLKKNRILMINMISSPGSGKTSLLEKIIPPLKGKVSLAVIEGDCYTAKDGERINVLNVPVIQINTQGSCHLNAATIHQVITELELEKIDLIFIENVGNLVCPAAFDLGEDYKMAIVSTAEGSDKPVKYPMLFRDSHITVLNKMDLLEHTDFDLQVFKQDIARINPDNRIFEISCKTGQGIEQVVKFFLTQVKK